MQKKRVFIMGGDRGGWALDTEARLARESLSRIPFVELVDTLREAEIVHTVWPEQLLEDPACGPVLHGARPVVASFSNDPFSLFERVPGLFAYAERWLCVAQSTKAFQELKSLALPRVAQVNYAADFSRFPVKLRDPAEIPALRRKWKLPEKAYLISSFQRDTEGADLSRLKIQKGADIFCAILLEVVKRTGRDSLHVVLGGPRRHWIRAELKRLGIPFTFLGEEVAGDDYPAANLPLSDIAELLRASDLNLVTSRWEGAPRALMEAASMGLPVLSTPEGIAEDLLESYSVFHLLPEAVERITGDIKARALASTVAPQAARLAEKHSIDYIYNQWAGIYRDADTTPLRAVSPLSRLTDSTVHHQRLHPWVRKMKLGKEKLSSILPRNSWVRVEAGEPLPESGHLALRVSELKPEMRSAAQERADAVLFSSFSLWKGAVAEGWRVRNPTVLREPLPVAMPSRLDGLVLFHSGRGAREDNHLADSLVPQNGGKYVAYQEALLDRANLLVTYTEDLSLIRAALSRKVVVVYRASEKVSELVGFCGLEFSDSPAMAIQLAWEYQESLRLVRAASCEPEEVARAWMRFEQLMKRRAP